MREHFQLAPAPQQGIFAAIDAAFTRHRRLVQGSSEDALQAQRASFAYRMACLQRELSEEGAVLAAAARQVAQLVADLTEASHRDPKTGVMTLTRFLDQSASFLSLEQRGRWCAVGVADIVRATSSHRAYGKAARDRIIDRVARLLREQVRAEDLVGRERSRAPSADLPSRVGGDELCFLIPDLASRRDAYTIGERFREAVSRYDWTREDPRLATRPVRIDVGIVSLRLGRVAERRFIARRLVADLIERADRLVHRARSDRARHTHVQPVYLQKGTLVAMTGKHSGAHARRPS